MNIRILLNLTLCLGAIVSCNKKNEVKAITQDQVKEPIESVAFDAEKLTWEEVVKRHSVNICAYREFEQKDGLRQIQVVFKDLTKKYSGYRYALEVSKEGDVKACNFMGAISTTGGYYCHMFLGTDEDTNFTSFKELYDLN